MRQYWQAFRQPTSLNNKHKAVLSAIECCCTERLGCHLDTCNHCGHREIQ
ncbi:transposase zinc-binding domain-containing protein [uncultured Desulfobulbus sp.]